MVDGGAELNVLDETMANQLGLEIESSNTKATAANGTNIDVIGQTASGLVVKITPVQSPRIGNEAEKQKPQKSVENPETSAISREVPEVPDIPFQENCLVPSLSSEPQIKQEDASVTEINISEADRDQGEPEETGGEASGGTEL